MERRFLPGAAMNRGRSPIQEQLDDIRDELLRAKKANARLVLNNRILNTKLQRLTRKEGKCETNSENLQDGKVGTVFFTNK
uniref:REM-1 domain-containing protein n=1 Tax=Angiostrongylus cantonensis TaxID=6313 RepID=A0A0K0D7W7_ANGCA